MLKVVVCEIVKSRREDEVAHRASIVIYGDACKIENAASVDFAVLVKIDYTVKQGKGTTALARSFPPADGQQIQSSSLYSEAPASHCFSGPVWEAIEWIKGNHTASSAGLDFALRNRSHEDQDRDREGMAARYTGRSLDEFGKYILLSNFGNYVEMFAERFEAEVLGKNHPMQSATAEISPS